MDGLWHVLTYQGTKRIITQQWFILEEYSKNIIQDFEIPSLILQEGEVQAQVHVWNHLANLVIRLLIHELIESELTTLSEKRISEKYVNPNKD